MAGASARDSKSKAPKPRKSPPKPPPGGWGKVVLGAAVAAAAIWVALQNGALSAKEGMGGAESSTAPDKSGSAAAGGGARASKDIELVPLTKLSLPSNRKLALVQSHEAQRTDLLAAARTAEEEEEYSRGLDEHKFNSWLSDKLPRLRRAYDTRELGCIKKKYAPVSALPRASVIVHFHNVPESALLRTVENIVQRTPPELLAEIVLADCGSTLEWTRNGGLEGVTKSVRGARLLKAGGRGIFAARSKAAAEAVGEVLVFLPGGAELNDGWLEPLLDRIRRSPQSVVAPVLDAIVPDTLEWRTGLAMRGAFDWALNTKADPFTAESEPPIIAATRPRAVRKTDPFAVPILNHDVFAVGAEWFASSGGHDPGMESWGEPTGHNIELGLRTWMCGGMVETVPCSHVAVLSYLADPHPMQPGDVLVTVRKNRDRVADVWLDDFAQTYFSSSSPTEVSTHTDTAERAAVRDSLKCKTFEWYLTNVFPDLDIGSKPSGGGGGTPKRAVQVPPEGVDPFADADDDEEGAPAADPFADDEDEGGAVDPFADDDDTPTADPFDDDGDGDADPFADD
mmetsp:Transcript_26157/g.78589  ORF Transcript_26157/g.78589 Transcript_26157/m.78589 type:complete len:568 (-) Transcript_26157:419-2122(-)